MSRKLFTALGCLLALAGLGAALHFGFRGSGSGTEDPAQRDNPGPPAKSITSVTGRGATLPFTELEAEHAMTNGTVIGPSRKHGILAGEASGRMAVTLDAGQTLTFTLTAPANALTLRYSIPDSADGAGQDAELRLSMAESLTRRADSGNGAVQDAELRLSKAESATAVRLTSRYSWFYGGFPFTNKPAQGGARHLYDSVRHKLGTTMAAGEKLTLTATIATTVDFADFEVVPEPVPRPDGSLSVLDYRASSTGTLDALAAFTTAIADAAAQRKTLYIPPGKYLVPGHLTAASVAIQGAGHWHTELTGAGVGIYGGDAVRVSDLAIIGEVTDRDDHAALAGVGGSMGGGSVLQRLWIQHVKVGIWLDGPFQGLRISDCRISDVTADGINLHQGISDAVITGNIVRNTGDDGIALWSEAGPDGFDGTYGADHHNTISFNTVQFPMLANGIAVYGGHDNMISDNVVADTQVEGGGIQVGNRFSATLTRGITTISRNTLLRAGGDHPFLTTPIGALWFYAKDAPLTATIVVTDNDLLDSTHAGVQFYGSSVTGVTITGLRIDGAGSHAFQIQAAGQVRLTGLTATGLAAAQVFHCPDANVFTITGTTLEPAYCGPFTAKEQK